MRSDARLDWSEIDPDVAGQLRDLEVQFDRHAIEQFAARIAGGELGPESNVVCDEPVPAGPDDVDDLARFSQAERERFAARGNEAIQRGAVAVAVLNGGMATRFGGVVKGIVEALDGRSFLEIKRAQALACGPVRFVVMNSFATHRATLEFLRARELEPGVSTFMQSVSLRLTPSGTAFRDRAGHVSLYAPGHGDFPDALRRSGVLAELEADGVRVLTLSNIDNLGADLDPVVIGHHLESGRLLSCEVAETRPGDVGGSPARVGGALQIVEGFRFPPGFEFSRLHYLATNSFTMSLELLREEHPLTWFYVEKEVDGAPVVQMERLVNELSARVATTYLATGRDAATGRFLPMKTLEALEELRGDDAVRARFRGI